MMARGLMAEHRLAMAEGLALYLREQGQGEPLLCLPGLTRNSRDFEPAAYLAVRHRMLCPDMRGRGRSDWDPTPEHYQPPTYVADMWQLLDQLGIERVSVLGTSLGGIMGMMMAVQQPQRVRALILNDVGAFTPRAALVRISGYLRAAGPVADWSDAAETLRAAFGEHFENMAGTDWLAFARRLYRERDGVIAPDYDPALLGPFQSGADLDLWPLFDLLPPMPVLVLRGEHSEILSRDVCEQMAARRPGLAWVEVPGRGHAPLLDEPEARAAIEGFLTGLA